MLTTYRKRPCTMFFAVILCAVLTIPVAEFPSSGPVAAYAQPTGTVSPSPELLRLQESFSQVASKIEPSVVNVSTVIEEQAPQYEFFFGSPFEEPGGNNNQRRRSPTRRAEGIASGVIISADGYILTNEHVVHEAKSIRVTLFDQSKFTGKVVGSDARTDLAVIKINPGKSLTFAKLGDSDQLKVGDWVLAVGSPFGLQATVTAGIISAKRQSLSIEGNNYSNLIQTDAAINRGNSGGPLCNIDGEVVAINTAIYAPTGVFSGVGFAIPVNNAKQIMDSLIHKGKVVRGWLGVEVRPVDEALARHFSLPDTDGVLVNNVLPRSPAAIAGIQRGDVIRAVDGKKVAGPQDMQTLVTQKEPNTQVTLQIIRNRKQLDIRVMAGEMPSEEQLAKRTSNNFETEEPEPQAADAEWQGMKVAPLNRTLAKKFDVPRDAHGCLVVDVAEGSAAADMGITPGDVITAINHEGTPTTNEFRSAVGKVKLSEGVVIDVSRQGRTMYLSYTQK